MAELAVMRRRLLLAFDLGLLGLVACSPADTPDRRELELAKEREASAREAERAAAEQAEAARELERARLDAIAQRQALAHEQESLLAEQAAKDAADLAALTSETSTSGPDPNGPIGGVPHFSCPSGEWCGSKSIAKQYRGEKVPENPDALGCPGHLSPKPGAGGLDQPEGHPPNGFGYAYLDVDVTKAKREQGKDDLCCYDWGSLCGGGRPLLDAQGRPIVAELEAVPGPPTRPELDARIAERWLADARMEHASIASFRRAAAELAALDAPPALQNACLRAADDEQRHADACFGLAAACGLARRPGALAAAPLREPCLVRLAMDTLVEGGIGETIAALSVGRAAAQVEDAGLRATLEQIAADELEHAALAWRTIAWALQRGGEPVREALLTLLERARPDLDAPLPEPDLRRDELARWGRLDAHDEALALRDAWLDLLDPIRERLAA